MTAQPLAFSIPHTYYARLMWIRINSVGSILDVACGEGGTYNWKFTLRLFPIEIHCPKIEVVAIDIKNYKTYGRKDRAVPKLPYFVQADAHQLPFKDKSFDTVTLSEVLEHPVDPVKLLTEAKRIACIRILVTVPDEVSWIKRRVFRHFSVFDSEEHCRIFSEEKLANYFKQAGLTSFEMQHLLIGDLEYFTAIVRNN